MVYNQTSEYSGTIGLNNGYNDLTTAYNDLIAGNYDYDSVQAYNSSRDTDVSYVLLKQMVNYISVDVNSNAYDEFTYTNRMNFYPYNMVGYTFLGWTSDASESTNWTNTDTDNYALFSNIASFVANVEDHRDENAEIEYDYNFYEILEDQILAGKVKLYARWVAEVYTIELNLNKPGLTPPRLYRESSNRYDRESQVYTISVVFDTICSNASLSNLKYCTVATVIQKKIHKEILFLVSSPLIVYKYAEYMGNNDIYMAFK
jgi:hypothetical protein